jgi:hypothetical protein
MIFIKDDAIYVLKKNKKLFFVRKIVHFFFKKMTEPANDERVFQILSSFSDESLSKRVSEYLRNGWLLHGTTIVTYNHSSSYFIYTQAVVKRGYVDR